MPGFTALRRDAIAIFEAAVNASDAAEAVRRAWPKACSELPILEHYERVFVLAVGKAAAAMAAALQERLGERLTSGIVLTKYGHAQACSSAYRVFEAAHPVPNDAGVAASREITALLGELTANDLLIVALSGGASALLTAPAAGVSLADKQRTTELLLRAGANIRELNAVRKHLSLLKGGRLAALAYPATVLALILSDVIGDPLDVIGSGPTAPDPTTFADALEVMDRFQLRNELPHSVLRHLERGQEETPKTGDEIFGRVRNVIVGSNGLALQAAADEAGRLGYRPFILTSRLQGEAREAARVHAAILREVCESGNPVPAPACLLSGGECTVSVRGKGIGGRAQEFALSAALDMVGLDDALLLCAGTDGTDGPTDAAGAIVTGTSVQRAKRAGFNPAAFLAQNDSYAFFDALGDLVKTGPTGTNVMDLCVMLARRN